ncbi:unnamed protein product [Echinostoma caproni]|uniref:Cadherin n=1 Tax=Echinostoma caproni TaxID=27848 RepID=A0A183A583_9TREM|nr:unnamed protein product [Echinostoma caproni]
MSNMPTMPLTAPVRFPRGTVWRIQEHTVHFTVEENCPVGTKLGKITPAQSPLTNGFEADSQLHSGVKYQFGAPSSLFTVDEQTGMVSTVGKIDAEQLCAKARDEERSGIVVDGWVAEEQPTILDRVSCPQNGSLTVHVDINMVRADASLVSIFRTIIHVKDLNDNAPYFDQPRWHRRLKEALYRKGRRLDLPKAQDNDVTLPNRQIRYRLEPSVKEVSNSFGPFRLEISPTGQPGLVLMEDLDAELYSAYHLILVAYGPLELDRDRTVNTGWSDSSQSEARLEIYIEVIDMNDNEPRFARTNYNISVSEDTPVGSIIYQLTAHDPDKSANLTYSIKPLEKGVLASSTFHVTPDGRVQLSGPLDYEGQRNYELPVQVKDGEFNAYTTLFVSVLDTNDEPPRFEINPKQIVASEHAVPGKLIGQVRIYDPDGEEINGHVRCFEPPGLERNQPLAFLPDPRQNPFALVYDLTTRVFLDRESEDQANGGQMRVYLVCTDGSDSRQHGVQYNEKHTSTMTIVLTVKDENDHPPVFDQPIYHVAVYENNAIGEKLIQVHDFLEVHLLYYMEFSPEVFYSKIV